MFGQAVEPTFSVISGAQVSQTLGGKEKQVVDLVAATYKVHGQGDTVNPPSMFLRFPDRPSSRIIALPASLSGSNKVDGLKWISSFPENVALGLPRASAVLILNDRDTGYPFACLESSIISASRTAASAVLAADWLSRDREGGRPLRVGFFGAGLIARYIHTYLAGTGWRFDEIGVHDLSSAHMSGFKEYLEATDTGANVKSHEAAEDLIRSSDLLVFATVAGSPHVTDLGWFSHNPLVLHVSLRDLAPEIILGSANVLDDVDHCLKANTSPHLAEQKSGKREFIDATLYEVTMGTKKVRTDRPVVFSPFGLGVLDLAVGKYVYDEIAQQRELVAIDGFFDELGRYGKR
jgi:ornithine cyclodeaminase